MKFIEYGIQDGTFAEKTFDPITSNRTVKLIPVKEHYLRFYLPWKRIRYVINIDNQLPMQPCFGIYWHSHPTFQDIHFARRAWQ